MSVSYRLIYLFKHIKYMELLTDEQTAILKELIRQTFREEIISLINNYSTGAPPFINASKLSLKVPNMANNEPVEPVKPVINQLFQKGWADMPDSNSYQDKKKLLANSFKRLDFAFACQLITDWMERKSTSSAGKSFGFFFAKAMLTDKTSIVLKIPGDSLEGQSLFNQGDYLTIEYYKKGIYKYTSKQNVAHEEKEIWAFANKIKKA